MKAVKIIWLVAATFMVADFGFAQIWTPATNAPSGIWTAVASSADGSKLIATKPFTVSAYAISTNSGATWITYPTPQSGGFSVIWFSLASSADGNILAGVDGSHIWVSTNWGTTWISNNITGSFYVYAVALSADGKKLVAATGSGFAHISNYDPGPIYTSTDSGLTLTPTTAPTNNWNSVASSADGTILVAAAGSLTQSNGSIYVSTNSGLTWMPTGAPTNNLWESVASSVDGSKMVAASAVAFVPTNTYGGIYTSTNFGMTWTLNNVPLAQWNGVASSADGTELVAVSGYPGLIYTSTNSGTSWVSNSVPNNNMWTSVASSADGNSLVAATFGPSVAPIYFSQSTPMPSLNLTASSGNLGLSWLIPSTNFVLQQSSDLVSWADMTDAPALNLTNLQNQVMLSPSNSSGFYRLKTP